MTELEQLRANFIDSFTSRHAEERDSASRAMMQLNDRENVDSRKLLMYEINNINICRYDRGAELLFDGKDAPQNQITFLEKLSAALAPRSTGSSITEAYKSRGNNDSPSYHSYRVYRSGVNAIAHFRRRDHQ